MTDEPSSGEETAEAKIVAHKKLDGDGPKAGPFPSIDPGAECSFGSDALFKGSKGRIGTRHTKLKVGRLWTPKSFEAYSRQFFGGKEGEASSSSI